MQQPPLSHTGAAVVFAAFAASAVSVSVVTMAGAAAARAAPAVLKRRNFRREMADVFSLDWSEGCEFAQRSLVELRVCGTIVCVILG
jgi:hypothetical protein